MLVVASKIKLIPHLRLIAAILNGPKSDMLVYPDYRQKWVDFGHRLLIFLIVAAF